MCGYNLKLVDVPRATLTTSPENGAYIWGLFMEGARCAIEILYLLLLLLFWGGRGISLGLLLANCRGYLTVCIAAYFGGGILFGGLLLCAFFSLVFLNHYSFPSFLKPP